MADLTFSRTTQQMTASGLSGLFGLFAGLCAISPGCVTLSDGYFQITQAPGRSYRPSLNGEASPLRRARQRTAGRYGTCVIACGTTEWQAADRHANLEFGIFGS